MARREFSNLNFEEDFDFKPPSRFSQGWSEFSQKAFGVTKFILGIFLLPFVYSSTTSFFSEFGLIQKPYQDIFWSGIVTFLVIYLFVWEPAIVYTKGHKLMELVFNFFKPLVKVAPFLLPIYTIILFVIYLLLSLIIKSEWLVKYCVFLLGFTIMLHLVFSARSMRSRKNDLLKGNYIFGFSFVYIINLLLLAVCLNAIFNEFSLVNYLNNDFQAARDVFYAIFQQLFLRAA